MFITIDIGATNTRVAFSKDLKKLENIEKFPTPKNPEELNSKLFELFKNKQIKAIAIGIAGPIDHYENKLISFTNVPQYKNMKASDFIPELKIQKALNNDAELANLGEVNFGIKNPPSTVAYITISSGIGGALSIDKKLLPVRFNTEPGHQVIEIGGVEEAVSKAQGTLEALCGGLNFKNLYGISPSKCKDKKIWESYAEDLAVGLHNISLLWSPDMIILGGGLSQKSSYFLEKLKDSLSSSLKNIRPAPEIEISKLGDENVLLGGLAVLRDFP